MRELAVFYCPKCGHYAYYQTSRHPQCPKCGCEEAMYMVRMHYTEFMRMSCDERDEFLSKEILKTNPSLVERLTAPHKRYNSREIIAEDVYKRQAPGDLSAWPLFPRSCRTYPVCLSLIHIWHTEPDKPAL